MRRARQKSARATPRTPAPGERHACPPTMSSARSCHHCARSVHALRTLSEHALCVRCAYALRARSVRGEAAGRERRGGGAAVAAAHAKVGEETKAGADEAQPLGAAQLAQRTEGAAAVRLAQQEDCDAETRRHAAPRGTQPHLRRRGCGRGGAVAWRRGARGDGGGERRAARVARATVSAPAARRQAGCPPGSRSRGQWNWW